MTKTETIKNLIKSSEGKTFGVVFKKKSGEIRTMNARLGVKAPLKGGENTVAHKEEYITVFDMARNNYRNVNCNTVMSLSLNGVKFDLQ